MDSNQGTFVPQNGMDVVGADGEKVGEIDAVEQDYFVVRKGFFFPQDHYIPLSAVSSYDEDKVYLNVTKDEAMNQDWGTPPAGRQEDLPATGGYVDDTTATTTGAAYSEPIAGDATSTTAAPFQDTAADTDINVDRDRELGSITDTGVDRGRVADQDRQTIDVHEEELGATKRQVDRGAVRVNKNVVSEEQTLDVPVTEEEVDVTRRRVDRDVTGDDNAFQEGTIEVPLRGEEVDVDKRARVVEEIDLDKTARQRNEQVSDTVRREEVTVEGDNVDNIDNGDTGRTSGRNRRDNDDESLLDKAKDKL